VSRYFILASGPSLDGFDYTRLAGKNVIAINDAAFYQFAAAPILISTDPHWWQSVARGDRKLTQWKGDTLICTEQDAAAGIYDPRMIRKNRKRIFGLSDDPAVLHGIFTGVHAAINEAVHRRATEIVLLGVDLKCGDEGERKYTYGGSTTCRTPRQFKNMIRALESCAPVLKKKKINVINASPDSALTCWRRYSSDQVIYE